MKTIPLSEFKVNPSKFMAEEITVTKNGKPLSVVTPVAADAQQPDLDGIKFGIKLIASMMTDEEVDNAKQEIAQLREQTVEAANG
ncbi:type II toxin-antitoxin system Phd/YefM family antitoxin [Leucobacter insecticola]|uniref:Type II toxin-antitoxin system Phd/YefM family antitoxin n=1 Tax=Leucobacter insecticola TaxID=2714934 RepID=A0A6G8FHJ7_9MICO|nr:type II toxin-antitoxin system prevent-host-death family antitoxin [Leucobacter insecticola]QIM15763.1 type II toxin-antitoxin system Phd/YefM family antitoxin [Leucobacter insecticola]